MKLSFVFQAFLLCLNSVHSFYADYGSIISASSGTVTFSTYFPQPPEIYFSLAGWDIGTGNVNLFIRTINVTETKFQFEIPSGTQSYKLQYQWLAVYSPDVKRIYLQLGNNTNGNDFDNAINSNPEGKYFGSIDLSGLGIQNPKAIAFVAGFSFRPGRMGFVFNILDVNSTRLDYVITTFVNSTLKSARLTLIIFENFPDYQSDFHIPDPLIFQTPNIVRFGSSNFTQSSATTPLIIFGFNSFLFNVSSASLRLHSYPSYLYPSSSNTWNFNNTYKTNLDTVVLNIEVTMFWILNKNTSILCTQNLSPLLLTPDTMGAFGLRKFTLNSCNCPYPYYLLTNHSLCVDSCPFPLSYTTSNFDYRLITYPCNSSQYLYWNRSCLSSCSLPNQIIDYYGFKLCYKAEGEFDVGYYTMSALSGRITFGRNFSSIPQVVFALTGINVNSGSLSVTSNVTSIDNQGFYYTMTSTRYVYHLDFNYLAYISDDFRSENFWLGSDVAGNPFAINISQIYNGTYNDSIDISSYGFINPCATAFISGFVSISNTGLAMKVKIWNVTKSKIDYQVQAYDKNSLRAILISFVIFEKNPNYTLIDFIPDPNAYSIAWNDRRIQVEQSVFTQYPPLIFYGFSSFRFANGKNPRFINRLSASLNFSNSSCTTMKILTRVWHDTVLYDLEMPFLWISKAINPSKNCPAYFLTAPNETDTPNPPIQSLNFRFDYCICQAPSFYNFTSKQCEFSCPNNTNCFSNCLPNEYQYLNGSCLKFCFIPNIPSEINGLKICQVGTLAAGEFETGYRTLAEFAGNIIFTKSFSKVPSVLLVISGFDIKITNEVTLYPVITGLTNGGFDYSIIKSQYADFADISWMSFVADDVKVISFWLGNDTDSNNFANFISSSPDGVYYGTLDISGYRFSNPNATIYLGGFSYKNTGPNKFKGVYLDIEKINQTSLTYRVLAYEKTSVKGVLISIIIYDSSPNYHSGIGVQASTLPSSTNANRYYKLIQRQNFLTIPNFFFGIRSLKSESFSNFRFKTVNRASLYKLETTYELALTSYDWSDKPFYNIEIPVFWIMQSTQSPYCMSDVPWLAITKDHDLSFPSSDVDLSFECFTCNSPKFYYPFLEKCVSSCPFPIDTTSNGVFNNICNYTCEASEFLFWNGSCLSNCPKPYTTNITYSSKFCYENIDYGCIRELNCSLTPNATFKTINSKFGIFLVEFDLDMNNTVEDFINFVNISLSISDQTKYNLSFYKISARGFGFQIVPLYELPSQNIFLNFTEPLKFKSYENIPILPTDFQTQFEKLVINCPDYCKSCLSTITCTVCEYGYMLKDGLCYKISDKPPSLTFTQSSKSPNIFYLTFSEPINIDENSFNSITSLKFDSYNHTFNNTIKKSSESLYEITIYNEEEIPSQGMTAFFSNNSLLISYKNLYYPESKITLQINYIPSLELKKSISKISGSISSGSSYLAVLSMNPMLLWMIITNLQPYYYILFYNVDLPLNLKSIMSVFDIARLNFFPDIGLTPSSNVHIKAPEKFSDQNIDGYFLKSGMSPIYSIISVYIGFCILFLLNHFVRRMPVFLRNLVFKLLRILNKPFFLNFWLGLYLDQTIMSVLQIRLISIDSFDDSLSLFIAAMVYFFNINLLYWAKKYARSRYDSNEETFLGEIVAPYKKKHRFMFFFSLLNKFLIGNIIVIFYDVPALQIWLSITVYVLYCCLCLKFKPTDDKIKNFIIIFNEAMMGVACSLLYVIRLMNMNNVDESEKFKVGWMILWLAVTHLLVIVLMSLRLNKLIELLITKWQVFRMNSTKKRLKQSRKIYMKENKFKISESYTTK